MKIIFNEVHRKAFTELCKRKDELKKEGNKLLKDTFMEYRGSEICGSLEVEFRSTVYGGQRKADIDETMKIITEYLW